MRLEFSSIVSSSQIADDVGPRPLAAQTMLTAVCQTCVTQGPRKVTGQTAGGIDAVQRERQGKAEHSGAMHSSTNYCKQ